MTKVCSTCKTEKSLDCFYPIANGVKGVRPRCKECASRIEREKYQERADLRWSKLSRQANKLRTDPEHRKKHMLAQRRWHLKKFYGMSLEDFDVMLDSQNGGCAICGTKPKAGEPGTRMVVDHCHSAGHVRGILCDICNTALGKFKDDIDLMHKAIRYLQK